MSYTMTVKKLEQERILQGWLTGGLRVKQKRRASAGSTGAQHSTPQKPNFKWDAGDLMQQADPGEGASESPGAVMGDSLN